MRCFVFVVLDLRAVRPGRFSDDLLRWASRTAWALAKDTEWEPCHPCLSVCVCGSVCVRVVADLRTRAVGTWTQVWLHQSLVRFPARQEGGPPFARKAWPLGYRGWCPSGRCSCWAPSGRAGSRHQQRGGPRPIRNQWPHGNWCPFFAWCRRS